MTAPEIVSRPEPNLRSVQDRIKEKLRAQSPELFGESADKGANKPAGEAEIADDENTEQVPDSSPGEAEVEETEAREEPEAEVEETKEPTPKKGDLSKALEKTRHRAQSAEGRVKALEAELAKVKGNSDEQFVEAILTEKRPEDFDAWDADRQLTWLSAKAATSKFQETFGESGVARLTEILREREVAKQVPGLSEPQLSAVTAEMTQNPALTPEDARVLAESRAPELFATDTEGRAALPASHRVAEPSRSGRRRAPVDKKTELKKKFYGEKTVTGRQRVATEFIKDMIFGS